MILLRVVVTWAMDSSIGFLDFANTMRAHLILNLFMQKILDIFFLLLDVVITDEVRFHLSVNINIPQYRFEESMFEI